MLSKDLVAASAAPLVLAILAQEESYGYAIIQEVKNRSGGQIEWTDGMLYPVLHRLERRHWIRARWVTADSGRRRRYYRITDAGRAALAEAQRQWDLVHETLKGALRPGYG